MRTRLTTLLDCSKERFWQEVQTPRLMEYVAAPLVTFDPLQPDRLPQVWKAGCYQVAMKLFRWLSLGRQWVVISIPQAGDHLYQLRDNGYGDRITRWDHWITIQEATDGKARYTDQVDIEAGLVTPLVWLFSQVFFRHRQRRLRKLVKDNFQYPIGTLEVH